MSCRLHKSSRRALAVAAFAALGAMVTMAMHAQRAAAEDAEDPGQEEGRIVTISPDVGDGAIGIDRVNQSLIAGDGQPARPAFWLGIQGQPLTSDVLRTHLQLAEGVGVVVEQVVSNSPAEKAGVRKHDVLLAVNGEQISDMGVLQQAVADSNGKPIELKVIRLAKEMTIEATPEATPENMDFGAAGAGAGGFPGAAGMFGGQNLPMDEIQAMLQQMQQNGVAGGMRIVGPGMVLGGQPLNFQNMPQNVQVTVSRDGDGPAKVTVKRGDETWTLEDGDKEALAKLPDDVRPFVEQMLQNNDGDAAVGPGHFGAFNFNFNGPEVDAIRQHAEQAARQAGQAAAQGAQELNQNLIQQLQRLEQRLQQLEQQIQQNSGDEGGGSADPTKT